MKQHNEYSPSDSDKLTKEFEATTIGWVIHFLLGLLILALSVFLGFLVFEDGGHKGWLFTLLLFGVGVYCSVIALCYRRGAKLRFSETGFSYSSGNIIRNIKYKEFRIIRAVSFYGMDPGIEIKTNSGKFSIETRWFKDGSLIFPILASMASEEIESERDQFKNDHIIGKDWHPLKKLFWLLIAGIAVSVIIFGSVILLAILTK
jgi:hypothetical protein